MTDLEALLTDLAALGWRFNNCYQTDNDLWRINLRRPTPSGAWFTDWAEAETFVDAITECMSKLLDAEFHEDTEVQGTIEPTKSLVELLGIRPKAPPIPRRF